MKMNLNKALKGLSTGLMLGISSFFYSPKVNADTWEIFLCNKFHNSATDQDLNDNFFARVDDLSLDSYTLGDDILNPPPVPGDYSDLTTLVDGNRLMTDSRAPIPLFSSKKWNLDLILGNQIFTPISGTNTIISDLSQFPSNYLAFLNDYGTDSSRTTLIGSTDLRAIPNYEFPTSGLGIVRYLQLDVSNVPEPSTFALVGVGIAGFLLRRKR